MTDDTIIVNIPALEEAISAFNTCNSQIGQCVSSLKANAAAIASAWTADASDTYQNKMQKLSENVEGAQTALKVEIDKLTSNCEKYRSTQSSTQSIADSVDSSFMV